MQKSAAMMNFVLFGIWCYHLVIKANTTRSVLHKIAMALPALKVAYNMINYLYFSSCPWNSFMSEVYLKLL